MNLFVWSGLDGISGYVLMDIFQIKNMYIFSTGVLICTSLGYMKGYTGADLITNLKSFY